MNHNELANDLASHLRGNAQAGMVWTDMQLGPAGSPRPDVYMILKSYANWSATAYEIKVSASDLLSDLTSGKWQSYLRFAHRVIFALPAELAKSHGDRIPAQCGIIVRSETGWRMKRRPISNQLPTLPHDAWMKLLIDGCDRARAARYAPETINRWAREAEERKKFGDETARIIAKLRRAPMAAEEEALEHEREIERLRERHRLDCERVRKDNGSVDLQATGVLGEICVALGIGDARVALNSLSEIRALLHPGRYNLLTGAADTLRHALRITETARNLLRPATDYPAARQETANDES